MDVLVLLMASTTTSDNDDKRGAAFQERAGCKGMVEFVGLEVSN